MRFSLEGQLKITRSEPGDSPAGGEVRHLAAGEILGGVSNVDLDVRSCCVNATLFSNASFGARGGDVYYLSHCERDNITRIAIADVQGHGEDVSRVSDLIYRFMRKYLNILDNAALLSELNRELFDVGLRGMTTAAVFAFQRGENILRASIAGHPPGFLLRAQARAAGWDDWTSTQQDDSPQILLGVRPDVRYLSREVPFEPGDRLFLYTDGLTEFPYPDADTLFGFERLQELLNAHIRDELRDVKRAILTLLSANPSGLAHDDLTLIVAEFAQAGGT